jgi:hypothetical protein
VTAAGDQRSRRRSLRQALTILVLFAGAPELVLCVRRTAASTAPAFADRRGFSRQLDRTLTVLRQADPSLNARLWFDLGDQAGPLYDSLSCSWMLCRRMMNSRFPDPAAGTTCDSRRLVPGMTLAVLSERPVAAVIAAAARALASVGLAVRPLGTVAVPGPVPRVQVTLLRIAAGDGRPRQRVGRQTAWGDARERLN